VPLFISRSCTIGSGILQIVIDREKKKWGGGLRKAASQSAAGDATHSSNPPTAGAKASFGVCFSQEG